MSGAIFAAVIFMFIRMLGESSMPVIISVIAVGAIFLGLAGLLVYLTMVGEEMSR
jgi:hypothetical protein